MFAIKRRSIDLCFETVEKLRFSDNLCLDFAKHGREKVPVQKLFLSQSIKAEVHAPSFYAFALQMLFDGALPRVLVKRINKILLRQTESADQ